LQGKERRKEGASISFKRKLIIIKSEEDFTSKGRTKDVREIEEEERNSICKPSFNSLLGMRRSSFTVISDIRILKTKIKQ